MQQLQETGKWCVGLCTLIHTVVDQPARGTEFTMTNIGQTTGGAIRGMLWMKKTIALLQTYSKPRIITESETMIVRFCPRQVVEIVLQYLVYVRRLELFLTKKLYNNDDQKC